MVTQTDYEQGGETSKVPSLKTGIGIETQPPSMPMPIPNPHRLGLKLEP